MSSRLAKRSRNRSSSPATVRQTRKPIRELHMNIDGKTLLITGANRGIGRALVEGALNRGAQRVYAGTRAPLAHSDQRVTPLSLDVTNASQIREAVGKIHSLDVLINNAGLDLHDDLSDRA